MPVDSKAGPHRPAIVRTHDAAPRCSGVASIGGIRDPDDFPRAEAAHCASRPTPLLRSPATETAKPDNIWPDYLEALELINGAGQAMTALEDHSQRIQARAFELTQKAKADRLAATQQIAALQQQLAASETHVAELDSRLAEAELRAQTAQEWLRRFLESIHSAFARQRTEPGPSGSSAGTAA
jgi:hypothetical protein